MAEVSQGLRTLFLDMESFFTDCDTPTPPTF
jgi:hypothetical protein